MYELFLCEITTNEKDKAKLGVFNILDTKLNPYTPQKYISGSATEIVVPSHYLVNFSSEEFKRIFFCKLW